MNIEKISVKEIKEYLKKDDLTKYGTMMSMTTTLPEELFVQFSVLTGFGYGRDLPLFCKCCLHGPIR